MIGKSQTFGTRAAYGSAYGGYTSQGLFGQGPTSRGRAGLWIDGKYFHCYLEPSVQKRMTCWDNAIARAEKMIKKGFKNPWKKTKAKNWKKWVAGAKELRKKTKKKLEEKIAKELAESGGSAIPIVDAGSIPELSSGAELPPITPEMEQDLVDDASDTSISSALGVTEENQMYVYGGIALGIAALIGTVLYTRKPATKPQGMIT